MICATKLSANSISQLTTPSRRTGNPRAKSDTNTNRTLTIVTVWVGHNTNRSSAILTCTAKTKAWPSPANATLLLADVWVRLGYNALLVPPAQVDSGADFLYKLSDSSND